MVVIPDHASPPLIGLALERIVLTLSLPHKTGVAASTVLKYLKFLTTAVLSVNASAVDIYQ